MHVKSVDATACAPNPRDEHVSNIAGLGPDAKRSALRDEGFVSEEVPADRTASIALTAY